MPQLHISFSSRSLSCGPASLASRSIGLFRFIAYLAWVQDQHGHIWVGVGELSRVLGALHGRQLQRYMDALAEAGLAVVDSKSKTRGPYRLAATVLPAVIDVTMAQMADFLHLPPGSATTPVACSEEALLADNRNFFSALGALVRADMAFQEGESVASVDSAYAILQPLAVGGESDLQVVAMFKQAKLCQRSGRDADFSVLLAAAEALAMEQQSLLNLQLLARLYLLRAKKLLDEGDRLAAATVLGKVRARDCPDGITLGRYYNLRGLIAFHEFRHERQLAVRQAALQGLPSPALSLLPAMARISEDYRHALVAQIGSADYQGLQATCFNFGNALLFGYRECPGAESLEWLAAGIGWVAHCDSICRQFGVGSDSVWSRIVLIDLALVPGAGFSQVQLALAELSISYDDLPQMMAETLDDARRIGNPLEEAEVLRQMMQFELQLGRRRKAEGYAREAIALLMTLQRQDKVRQVRAILSGHKRQ